MPIWLFWRGAGRAFAGWYVNIQEPFRRTVTGYDTQDLELDIWIPLDRPWEWKDEELLERRVEEGRFTAGAGRRDSGRGRANRRRARRGPPLVGRVVGRLAARSGLADTLVRLTLALRALRGRYSAA